MRAKNLIEENGWCQGCEAKSRNGRHLAAYDERATKYSLLGAIKKAYSPQPQETEAALDRVYSVLTRSKAIVKYGDLIKRLVEFNDDEKTKVEDVISLLKKSKI